MNKIFSATCFINYLLKSKNEHGVHSPFVFALLNQVIYNKEEYYAYSTVESIRAKLSESEVVLECTDLGAGSKKTNGIKKSVKQITRDAAKPAKYAQLVFRLVNYFQPQTILELGTSLGITASYISRANSKAKFTTIEGCREIAEIARQNFSELDIKNAELIVGNFDEKLPIVLKNITQLDFVFFDGNHQKLPTLSYFNQCLEKATENSVFVFDDIYWSKEMKEAWKEIKKNKKVTVTIDLFFMGIIFFRKEQAKQDFIIKF